VQTDEFSSNPVTLPTYHLESDPSYQLWLRFSPDGKWLSCWGYSGHPTDIWNTENRQKFSLPAEERQWRVAFSPGNERLAAGGPNFVSVFEWPSARLLRRIPWRQPHEDITEWRLEFTGPNELLRLNSRQLWLWNTDTGAELLSWEFGEDEYARNICTCGSDLIVFTTCPAQTQPEGWSDSMNRCLTAMNFRSKERTVVCGPPLCPWEIRFAHAVRRALVRTSDVMQPDKYELWDLEKRSCCGKVSEKLHDMLLSADARYVVARREGAFVVWDTRYDRLSRSIELGGAYAPIEFSPKHLVVAGIANFVDTPLDRTLFMDVHTGACLGETSGHPMQPAALFSPCGRWFASAMSELEHSMSWQPAPIGTVLLSDLEPILARATPIGGAPA